jgi:hypothetical protein
VNEERFDAILDVEAMLSAEPAEKIATALAWREMHDPSNSLSSRQEWTRAFGRFVLPYVCGGTTRHPTALTN